MAHKLTKVVQVERCTKERAAYWVAAGSGPIFLSATSIKAADEINMSNSRMEWPALGTASIRAIPNRSRMRDAVAYDLANTRYAMSPKVEQDDQPEGNGVCIGSGNRKNPRKAH